MEAPPDAYKVAYLWDTAISQQFQGLLVYLIMVTVAFALPPWRTARAALHSGISQAISSQGKLLSQEAGRLAQGRGAGWWCMCIALRPSWVGGGVWAVDDVRRWL